MLSVRSVYGNEKGVVLVVALVFLVVLGVMGSAAVMMARGDLKISGNYKNSEQTFYAAEAGIEHARETLRGMNESSADISSFTDELGGVTGSNGILDGYASGTDDTAIINAATLGNGSYTVYLTNDSVDGSLNQTDSNNTVTLTSVATGPNGSKTIIETTVSLFDLFPPPATITLLGPGASFTGNNSNAKDLHGDDQCGTAPPKPVVAVSHVADVGGVQSNINSSKPNTYHTKDEFGNDVTAFIDPDAITEVIPASMLMYIKTTYGIDLLDAADLNGLVTKLQKIADTVAPGGSNTTSVDVGAPGDTKVVVVTGDFSLNGNGAGILTVTGELIFNGNVNYDGVILVIGDGSMRRNGGGNGTISGFILVANTSGPDGIPGTGDDALGPPTFNTAGGGNSNVDYCSTAINYALGGLPLSALTFRHFF